MGIFARNFKYIEERVIVATFLQPLLSWFAFQKKNERVFLFSKYSVEIFCN